MKEIEFCLLQWTKYFLIFLKSYSPSDEILDVLIFFLQIVQWCSVLGRHRKHKMLSRTSHAIALCSIANFINSADRVIMPIAIVPMADEYKWDLHGQGWVLSSFAVGYMSSQVILWAVVFQWICNERRVFPLLVKHGKSFTVFLADDFSNFKCRCLLMALISSLKVLDLWTNLSVLLEVEF